MSNRRLAAALMGTGEFFPFNHSGLFTDYKSVKTPDELQENDVLVVWGGADISPSLYNKAVSSRTGAGDQPSYRDKYEWGLMQRAKEMGLPIVGVCRGAQMLCALAGGFLIQDVKNHGGSGHYITTHNDLSLKVNSIHHQMMYPFEVDHKMLATTPEILSPHHLDVDTDIDIPCEPEAVWFPEVKGLAIQWHPEFMEKSAPSTKWVFEQMKGHMNV